MKVTVTVNSEGIAARGEIVPYSDFTKYVFHNVETINDKGDYIELIIKPENVYIHKEALITMICE